MKQKILVALPIFAALTLSGCATSEQKADQRLSDQSVMAVNWMQQSGEYQALAWQAFNLATQSFDNAPSLTGKTKAVIVDLDETMIDNSAHQAWQAKEGLGYSEKAWSQWTQARQARAIPGAVEFANYVNSHGGKMFYVSNRDIKDYDATVANLQALGFTGVSKETVLLKSTTSNKQERFNQVASQGYNVVLYVGDNLSDFTGDVWHKTNATRRDFVSKNHAQFGTRYIVLPNPTYGDWESGLAADYNKKTPQQKLEIREQNLRVWQPSK